MAICALLLGTGVARAESPYRSTITHDAAVLRREARTPAALGRKFPQIKLQAQKIRGLGRVSIVLSTRKLPAAAACFVKSDGRCVKDHKVPVLFRGFVRIERTKGAHEQVPAAATVIDGQIRVNFSARRPGSGYSREKMYSVRWNLASENQVVAKVHGTSGSALAGKLCGATHDHSRKEASRVATKATPVLQAYRVVTISTDADPQWYAKYGENSNVEIAAIVNAAEAIFERQLGVRFALVRQHVYTTGSPYASTDASVLLKQFASNPDNSGNLGFSPLNFDGEVDVKHLFTGKDLDGTTVGIAYVSALCWAPKSSYGLSQDVKREITISIFAHELGHTFGAQHDLTDSGGLMYPSVGRKNYFSSVSVEEMTKHLAFMGKCVSEELLRPNLATATLTLKRKRSKDGRALKFYGRLVSASSKPLAGEIVRLKLNSREVLIPTNDNGVYSYVVNLRKVKVRKLTVFAETVGKEASIPAALKVPVTS